MVETPLFKSVSIVGIGLIGSSLARALRKKNLVGELVGFDKNTDNAIQAHQLGVVDRYTDNFQQAVQGADLIILGTPVGAIETLCNDIETHADDDTIIMDVGSIKGSIAKAASKLRDALYFVPAHPVAGTEQSGPEAGFASLFQDRWCILTPLPRIDEAYLGAVSTVETLWRGVGSMVETMDTSHHDLALAVTSHLPHLLAFTLVGAADDLESVKEAEIIKYSAGGFRDFTRIAASDPTMWRDVFLNNKEAVLEVLGRFSEELAVLQRAIRWGDGDKLTEVFTRGRALREAIVEAGQETDEPNFGRDG